MKLIFDLTKTQPLNNSKFHGGGKYGEIVFKALVEQSDDIIAFYNSSNWLNPKIVDFCKSNQVKMVDANHYSIKEVAVTNQGVIYSPIIDKDISKFGNTTYICTIHGLRTLEMPFDWQIGHYEYGKFALLYSCYKYFKSKREYSQQLHMYKELGNFDNLHFFTVSEHSKASMLSFIPQLDRKEIKVFYSPVTTTYIVNAIQSKNRAQEKYYLMVSANRWIKNSLRAIKAFDEIFTDFPNFEGKVILTGIKDKSFFTTNLINPSRFEFLDYVDDEELFSLYKDAYLFVYPSLNEGFGYPPLEAMAHGTPVIVSAIASLPEICGDAVLYFNPYLVTEIKMRILQMEDTNVHHIYSEKANERFKFIERKQLKDLDKLVRYLLSFLE